MCPAARRSSSPKDRIKRSLGPSPDASAGWQKQIPASWHEVAYRGPFRRQLLRWFTQHQRDLPWRQTSDPYAIWLSEIMLQQTQVQTVRPYFERFLAAFPTVEALAQARQEQVLRLWEGLGYYRRAVQLHQAAQKIMAEFDGQFPQTLEQLQQLPGIGRYTAGAILSIAFDQRQPILEANTTRLWARLLGYPDSPTTAKAHRLFWHMAEWILPYRHVGRFNQALMELGSTVCLPREPRCPQCPVAGFCRAFQEGKQKVIPQAQPKPALEYRHEAALIVRRKDRVLIYPIPEGQRWAGLWDFPRLPCPFNLSELQTTPSQQLRLFPGESPLQGTSSFPSGAESNPPLLRRSRRPGKPKSGSEPSGSALGPTMEAFLVHQVQQWAGIVIQPIRFLKTIRYGVTRFRIRMDCYEAEYVGPAEKLAQAENLEPSENRTPGANTGPAQTPLVPLSKETSKTKAASSIPASSNERPDPALAMRWVRLDQLDAYPLSSPGRKLAQMAQNRTKDT